MLHRRVAVALEDLHPDALPELAFHWGRAGSRPRTRRRLRGAGGGAGGRPARRRGGRHLLPPGPRPARPGRRATPGGAAHRARRGPAAGGARRTPPDPARRGRARPFPRRRRRPRPCGHRQQPGSKPSTFGITDHERVATLEAALNAVGPATIRGGRGCSRYSPSSCSTPPTGGGGCRRVDEVLTIETAARSAPRCRDLRVPEVAQRPVQDRRLGDLVGVQDEQELALGGEERGVEVACLRVARHVRPVLGARDVADAVGVRRRPHLGADAVVEHPGLVRVPISAAARAVVITRSMGSL